MVKEFVRKIGKYATLYRDDKTGIAWIEDGSTGLIHSCHPNISASGSVHGMKQMGYWDKTDKIIESHGFKYNISKFVIDDSDEYDVVASNECRCQECLKRRSSVV